MNKTANENEFTSILFINTGLQPGGVPGVDITSRFNGFEHAEKTVETV
jgi:hypothetical protein